MMKAPTSCHLHVLDAWHVIEELFNLTGIDVLTATDDHVLDTSRDAIITVFVLHAQISRMKEAVGIDNLCGSLGVLVIAFHHIEAAAAHLALNTWRTFLTRFRINNPDLYEGEITTNGGTTLLEGVGQTGLRHTGRTLGKAVNAGNGHEHLLRNLFHEFHRAQTACHDACAQG